MDCIKYPYVAQLIGQVTHTTHIRYALRIFFSPRVAGSRLKQRIHSIIIIIPPILHSSSSCLVVFVSCSPIIHPHSVFVLVCRLSLCVCVLCELLGRTYLFTLARRRRSSPISSSIQLHSFVVALIAFASRTNARKSTRFPEHPGIAINILLSPKTSSGPPRCRPRRCAHQVSFVGRTRFAIAHSRRPQRHLSATPPYA